MDTDKFTYRSYLLRLWRRGDAPIAWLVSLENPQSGERLGFPNFQAMLEYLQAELEDSNLEESTPEEIEETAG